MHGVVASHEGITMHNSSGARRVRTRALSCWVGRGTRGPLEVRGLPYVPAGSCWASVPFSRRLMLRWSVVGVHLVCSASLEDCQDDRDSTGEWESSGVGWRGKRCPVYAVFFNDHVFC